MFSGLSQAPVNTVDENLLQNNDDDNTISRDLNSESQYSILGIISI